MLRDHSIPPATPPKASPAPEAPLDLSLSPVPALSARHAQLLAALIATFRFDLAALADAHNVSAPELIDFTTNPAVQSCLARVRAFTTHTDALHAAACRRETLSALTKTVTTATDPRECRLAATALLRYGPPRQRRARQSARFHLTGSASRNVPLPTLPSALATDHRGSAHRRADSSAGPRRGLAATNAIGHGSLDGLDAAPRRATAQVDPSRRLRSHGPQDRTHPRSGPRTRERNSWFRSNAGRGISTASAPAQRAPDGPGEAEITRPRRACPGARRHERPEPHRGAATRFRHRQPACTRAPAAAFSRPIIESG